MIKIVKLTKGKILDITAAAMLLSFMLGISITNMGSFPYEEAVELENFIASIVYISFTMLFVWFCDIFQRKRLIIMNTIVFTTAFLFSLWYFAATLSSRFLPSSLENIFAILTYAFHSQFIGIYYIITPIDRVIYGTTSCLFAMLTALISWFFLLQHYDYFYNLKISLSKRKKKEHLSKAELMRREIKTERETEKNSNKNRHRRYH